MQWINQQILDQRQDAGYDLLPHAGSIFPYRRWRINLAAVDAAVQARDVPAFAVTGSP